MTNPFLDIFAPAGGSKKPGGTNPFVDIFSAPPADLSTGKKRNEFEHQSLVDTRDKLKSIIPKDDGHKRRLAKLVNSLEMQIADKTPGRSSMENFIRGTAAGIATSLQFPVELAGNVLSMMGSKDLQNYIEENRALIKEDLDPEGKAGTAGEIFGGVIGSAPSAGGAASAVGKGIIRLAPSTRIAKAIAAAAEGTLGQRVASNVITGLPINAIQAAGAADPDIPLDASPEERARMESLSTAAKIKNFAIGIGADALFGALPVGRKRAGTGTPMEVKPADVPITPDRQAQLDKVKAQNAVKNAVKRRERLDKVIAQSEWQILNPDTDWKELNPTTKRKVYDDFRERRRNSNPNTSTEGNPPEMQQQVVSVEEQLKALRGERDDARRLSETDSKLSIGNDRALMRASANADKDKNLVYIFADANGQKNINDALGYEAGDGFLTDARDAMLAAHQSYGIKPRLFRFGGDELVAIVPRQHAETILEQIESKSIKQYGTHTGSLSGAIHETLGDALSTEGKAKLASRKIEAKAKQNIAGRNNEEQILIDAARQRINTEPAPVLPTQAVASPAESPFPPEVMETIGQVRAGGGLQTDESLKAFTEELGRIYNVEMDPEVRASELQSLVEDFTPLDMETPDYAVTATRAEPKDLTQAEIQALGKKLEAARVKALDMPPGAARDKAMAAADVIQTNYSQAMEADYKRIMREHEATKAKPAPAVDPTTPTGTEYRAVKTKSGELVSQRDFPDGTSHLKLAREWIKKNHPDEVPNEAFRKYFDQDGLRGFVDRETGAFTDPNKARESNEFDTRRKQQEEIDARMAAEDAAEASPVGKTLTEDIPDPRDVDAAGRVGLIASRGDKVTPKIAAEIRAAGIKTIPVTEGTILGTVSHAKPLEKLSTKDLDRLDDMLLDSIESVQKDSPEYRLMQQDMDAIGSERARRKGIKEGPSTLEKGEAPQPARYGQPTDDIIKSGQARPSDILKSRLPDEVVRIRRLSIRKASDADLNAYIEEHETLRRETADLGQAAEAQKRIDRAMEERALRAKASDATMPAAKKSAIEGTAGFAFGFAADPQDDDQSDRTTNGLMWAAIAATGGFAIARMRAKARHVEVKVEPSDHWPGSDVAGKKIVNYDDVEVRSPSWRERAREWYQGIVRRSYAMDNAVNVMTGDSRAAASMGASRNPAKLASMFGRWISMAEGALMDKPVYIDYAGNVVPLPAQSFREIAAMVGGDLRGLGKLMTARTSIEGRGLRGVPLDEVTSDLIFRNAPEHYHKAADAMRQFDLAMTNVLEQAGVLQPGSSANFAQEEFYAGLKKVFDPDAGPSKIVRDPKTRKLIISQNPVKGRKQGTTTQVYNPAETTASMVPQVYRSAELNTIKNRLIDLWEATGKQDHILKQVERRKQPVSVDQQLRIDALKQEINGLSQADAEALVAAFDPKSLDPRSNIMTVYRDGVLRAYKVDEGIAQAMASLTPDELEGMWKVLGFPANMAKKGIVLNPYFVAKQSFIDGWQATLNSQYGFRPGVDQFIGWYNIIRRTDEYKQFVSAGGGHSTLQSHDYANVKTALKAIEHGGGGPLETAAKQAREFKLVDAWKTLIVPFSEAARVGEYLRARDHGAPVLDAVYAAKHVTANFQQRGGFTAMRGLDRASMFLNPAIQGLDQALFRAGANPFRVPEEGRKAAATKYLSKAFVGITLPSMYFWFMNKDDQQISDLRKTPSGAKYWFMRSPVDLPKAGLKKGDIVKIPKPIADGQIFGTTMEAYLDKAYGDDPAQMSAAGASMLRDVGFNILPTAGVLYYGLQFNKNVAFGSNLIPQGDENLALAHQGEDRASWISRKISEKTTPLIGPKAPEILKNALTPAGIDYVVNTVGGMLGQDALLAVSQAVEVETKGYVPAKEELPIIQKVFAGYPTSNVMPLRRFYDRAEQVQTVGATINHLVREDPTRLVAYMASNQADFILVGLMAKARQDIANYRRAYQDLKDMPAGALSSDDRRNYLKQYQILMIETARQANTFVIEVDKMSKPYSSPSRGRTDTYRAFFN